MKRHLMVLGDIRIGDCSHVGTYLNKLKDKYETTWIHGQYEKDVVHFLRDHCELGITETIEKPSLCLAKQLNPVDLNSVNAFLQAQTFDTDKYDKVTVGHSPLFFEVGDPIVYKTKNLPIWAAPQDYIVIHTDTISRWKCVDILFNLPFKIQAYAVGLKHERHPPNSSSTMMGAPLSIVAAMMLRAKCVVGLHSSMICLAFHLGVPFICCDFWGGGDHLKFSDYRDRCIHLSEPTVDNIMEGIKYFGGY